VLGCPDNTTALRAHAGMVGVPPSSPYIPDALLALLRRTDASTAQYTASDPGVNPFFGKRILNIIADDDESVPISMYEHVWDGLNVGPAGKKRTLTFKGRHVYTSVMMREMVQFFWEEAVEQDVRARL